MKKVAFCIVLAALLAAELFAVNVPVATATFSVTELSAKDVNMKYDAEKKVLTFTTDKHGDSLYAVMERFGIRETKQNLVAFVNANSNIQKHPKKWIFKPGQSYVIPAEFRETFLKAAGYKEELKPPATPAQQAKTDTRRAGAVEATTSTTSENRFPWMWLLGSLVGIGALALAAPPIIKRIAIRWFPVSGLPPISRDQIDPGMEDAPQRLDLAFKGLQDRINDDINKTGSMEFLPVVEQDGILTPINGAPAIRVTKILHRIGPIYRGKMKQGGTYYVRNGNSGQWQLRTAIGGEFVYRSRFKVQTHRDGKIEEAETDLLFLQICTNDLRMGNNYLFGQCMIEDWKLVPGTEVTSTTAASSSSMPVPGPTAHVAEAAPTETPAISEIRHIILRKQPNGSSAGFDGLVEFIDLTGAGVSGIYGISRLKNGLEVFDLHRIPESEYQALLLVPTATTNEKILPSA